LPPPPPWAHFCGHWCGGGGGGLFCTDFALDGFSAVGGTALVFTSNPLASALALAVAVQGHPLHRRSFWTATFGRPFGTPPFAIGGPWAAGQRTSAVPADHRRGTHFCHRRQRSSHRNLQSVGSPASLGGALLCHRGVGKGYGFPKDSLQFRPRFPAGGGVAYKDGPQATPRVQQPVLVQIGGW
jgi:hypothetical protein